MVELARLSKAVDADRTSHGLTHLAGIRPNELIKDYLTPSGLIDYLGSSTNSNEKAAHRYLEMAFRDLHQSAKPIFAAHFDDLMTKLQASPAELNKFLDDTISDSAKRSDFKARLGSGDASIRSAAKNELRSYLSDKLDTDPTTMLKLSEHLSPYSTQLEAKAHATNGLISTTKNALLASLHPNRAQPNGHLGSGNRTIDSLLNGAVDEVKKHPILTATVVAAAVAALLESTRAKEDEERRALLKILDEKEASNARVRELEGNYPELNGALDHYKSSDPRVILTLAGASDMATKAQRVKAGHKEEAK